MKPRATASTSTREIQVFVLRFWLEDLGGGKDDWRGRVQHVASGETRYFRGWSALEAFIEAYLASPPSEKADPEQPKDVFHSPG